MIVNIAGDNISLTSALKKFIEEKTNKINAFGADVNMADVIIKKDGLSCIAEFKIQMPKAELHATAKHENMYKAIDDSSKKIISQVKKSKMKRLKKHGRVTINSKIEA